MFELPAPALPLGWLDCVLEPMEPPVLELPLVPELMLGALDPPAALDDGVERVDEDGVVLEDEDGAAVEPLALDFFECLLEVEPDVASFFFLPLALCLPLFMCSRPCASVVTFGLLVGPALFVSVSVVAPAPLVEDLSLDVEP